MKTVPLITTRNNSRILFVMAAEAEYGAHLRTRFTPLMTGVGPVESAVVLSACLARLEAQNLLPDLVVSIGSAGSRTLVQAGVYQVSSVSYRDMDASALGFEKGHTPFLDLPRTLTLPYALSGVSSATISTGANIVSGVAYNDIDADMVDMETFAVMRACMLFQIPLIGLRGVSDGKAELTHLRDWTEYLHIIDEKLAEVVDTLFMAVDHGLLD